MENMTIKDLAQVAGVSAETIRRTAKKMFPRVFKRGVKTLFTKEQCFDIMRNTNRKTELILPNEETQPPQKSKEVVEPINYESIGKMIGMAVAAALTPVVDRLDKLSNQKALPEPIKEDSYSLVAYCKIKEIKINQSQLAMHGMALKKISKGKGIELKKIPDERWGFVNSYPTKILDEYFAG